MIKPFAVVLTATAAALIAGAGAIAAVEGGLRPAPRAPSAVHVAKSPDGHFWITATAGGGESVRMLVDTGASAVALTLPDAQRLGVDVDSLRYTRSVITAAGPAQAAPVMLARLDVAGAPAPQVQALVVRHGLDSSLLGMSYLGRLNGFSADREGLTLLP